VLARAALRRVAALVRRAYLRAVYLLWEYVGGGRGIEAINGRLLRRTDQLAPILRQFGATIGPNEIIHGPLIVHNADGDYSNLRIGGNVHVARLVLLDLSAPLVIEDEAVISMGSIILTHTDVGNRPLRDLYPRRVEETRIGAGSWVGASATILCGCHVGREAVVAAGAVVTKPVPDLVIAAGVPARIVRQHREPDTRIRGEISVGEC
jgi:acetyltransferase-like isoleucine patch superfamily enzyme